MQNNSNLTVSIRRMTEADASAVASISTAAIQDSWTEKAFIDIIQNPVYLNLVAKTNDIIIGYISVSMAADEADITNIAIDSRYRRNGIADKLLQCTFEYASNEGINKIFLEVRQSNLPAIALYEKNDFITLGIRKNYYSNPKEDAIIMQKNI